MYQVIKAIWAAVAIHSLHPTQPISPAMRAMESKQRMERAAPITERFNKLVREGKYGEAENSLKELSSYVAPLDLARQTAELDVSKGDFKSALFDLRQYFDGTQTERRAVFGAVEERSWYWFLLVQNGETEKSERVLKELFDMPVRCPMGGPYLEPEKLSKVRLAQVYMYLAGYYSRTTNYYRSDLCIGLAKAVDPGVKVDPGFEKIATMYGYVKGQKGKQEEHATLAMLSHVAFENATKLKARIQ